MALVWKILKFVLIWTVLAIAIVFGAIIITNSAVLGLKILGVIFSIWLVLYIIIIILKRRASKKRVERLVNLERGSADGIEEEEESWFPFKEFFSEDRSLYRRVQKIIKYLDSSKLKLMGSAIYAKPWYLVVGEAGSSKENLFENSDIQYPITNLDALASEDGDVDFYLTNDSIFISTSDVMYPGHGAKIPSRLVQLLKVLSFHRPQEPINGLLLTLDVEDMANMSHEEVKKLAEKHRFYLSFFMLYLGIQIPVQLLLMNGHKLKGFPEWVELLTEEQQNNVLGSYNTEGTGSLDFLEEAIAAMRYKIESVLNLLLANHQDVDFNMIQLSNEIGKLKENLKLYSSIVFSLNEYQENAFLYGVFLTGLKQRKTSTPLLCFAKNLLEDILPRDRGRVYQLERFRKRFFSYSAYFLMTWIGISAVAFAVIWQLAFSNVRSITSLISDYKQEAIKQEIIDYSVPEEDLLDEQIMLMQQLDITLESFFLERNIETANFLVSVAARVYEEEDSWWLPWSTLTGNKDIGLTLRRNIYTFLRKRLFKDLDSLLESSISNSFSQINMLRLSEQEKQKQVADYVLLLYYRIDVLERILGGASQSELRWASPFLLDDAYFGEIEEITQRELETLNKAYLRSLIWHREGGQSEIRQELENLRELLDWVLEQSTTDLQWIIGWADQTLRTETVNIEDFFMGSGKVEPPLIVGASYTQVGEKLVDDFIIKMLSITDSESGFYRRLLAFRQRYINAYTGAWSDFALNAYRGTEKLRTRDEWFMLLQQLSSGSNPYFAIIDRINQESTILLEADLLERSDEFLNNADLQDLQDLIDQGSVDPSIGEELRASSETKEGEEDIRDIIPPPEWVVLSEYYQQIKSFSKKSDEGKNNSKLTRVALKAVSKAGKAGKQVAKVAKKSKKMKKAMGSSRTAKTASEMERALEKSAAELDRFIVALTDIAFEANTRSFMFNEINTLFKNANNPAEGGGPLGTLYDAVKNMQFLVGIESRFNEPFWRLFYASIETVQQFMAIEAQLELQDIWRKEMLLELQGVSDYRLPEVVFGSDTGLFWKFAQTHLTPFIEILSTSSVVPREVRKTKLGFHQDLMDFYMQGRLGLQHAQDSYPVFFEAGPVSVNPEALFKPVKTMIAMTCEDKTYISINLNFFSRDLFEWSPSCGDLVLSIDFSVFSVNRIFKAPGGFPEFIEKFVGGSYQMSPGDFPDDETSLRDLNVEQIDLRYNVVGKEDLFKGIEGFPKEVPQIITKNWADLFETK